MFKVKNNKYEYKKLNVFFWLRDRTVIYRSLQYNLPN